MKAVSGFDAFAQLVLTLGTTTKATEKQNALTNYFKNASDADKVWVIALFSGRRPKRAVNTALLQLWATEISQIPAWLFQECYDTVGDLGETLSLILPLHQHSISIEISVAEIMIAIKQLVLKTDAEKKEFVLAYWKQLNQQTCFVFNKLLSGSFRIGVSQKSIVNALEKTEQLPASTIAHAISGNWDAATTSFVQLMQASTTSDSSKPYPFYLAYPLENATTQLGEINEWQAEWKWDGIRGQIIKRNDTLFIWSRGEELMTDKFPELHYLQNLLPNGTVIDGELIPAIDGNPLPFALMQTRIGRKTINKKQLLEAPIHFFAYDCIEYNQQDIREKSLTERRLLLENLVQQLQSPHVLLSQIINAKDWETLAEIRFTAREKLAEGIMLKRKNSSYQVGRKVGDWWKWKIDPLTIDAVLLYAQKGHGRRSNLFTDYTFAVSDGEKLVTFAKAYSGLTDKEFAQVDAFVKANAIEKFGPVRTVKPELVFELAFEGIAESKRHKSGVAVRFPRMLRWRHDKKLADINTLQDLQNLLHQYGKK